jgi:hypothetical protein
MSFFERSVWLALPPVLLVVSGRIRADEQTIQHAIERGVAYLRSSQAADGHWSYAGSEIQRLLAGADAGATALAALALLECDVPKDDPAIQKAATFLRSACNDLTFTYSVSACVMFFDRLADPQDISRIEVLTLRLLGAQAVDGTWNYVCPAVGEQEVRQLKRLLEKQDATRTTPNQPNQSTPKQQARRELPTGDEIRLPGARGNVKGFVPAAGDHSNSQFASFALWIGRRRGFPVRDALAAVERNCRLTQVENGTWGYRTAFEGGVNASMTCAGLMGLALAYGLANDLAIHTKKPVLQEGNDDPYVRRGLLALGSIMDSVMMIPKPGPPGGVSPPTARVSNQSQNYFLWSLERVAIAYGLETIANRDWYRMGSELLVATQQPAGNWDNEFTGNVVETAFGLLFLRRANLAKDLSATLKGSFRDPGKVSLRAEGALKEQRRNRDAKDAAGKLAPKHPLSEPLKSGFLIGLGEFVNTTSPEARQLSSQLLGTSGEKWRALLEKLRDTKGNVNTEALALAISDLSGRLKTEARDALAERLCRMTSETLRDKCKDQHPEVRRASALACAMKEDKRLVPDLIDLLQDPEPGVARAAAAALRSLTKQDFGPAAHADAGERAKAQAQWRQWWTAHRDSSGEK